MKTHSVSERGQVLVLIALAIIGLVGITGVAIDGSMILADRRKAQNAADTAALAGALAKIQAQAPLPDGLGLSEEDARAPMRIAAQDRAISNGYYPNLLSSQVEVYTCDETDLGADCPMPYDGDSDYVQVIITSHVDTYLARVVGIPQLHNRVEAIALADDDDTGPAFPGDSIVAVSDVCQSPDNFIVEGGAKVVVDGGKLHVNTEDPACGFKCDTNNSYIQGDITTSGGDIDISANCSANNTGTRTEGGKPAYEFPIYLEDLGLDIPPECDGPTGTYANYPAGYDPGYTYPGYPDKPVTILTPGFYGQFPPKKEQPLGDLNDIILLQPGTYCVADVLRWNQPNFTLIGHGVTLFMRTGYYFSLTGGVMELDAPTTGDYQGYVMIVEPDYTVAPENCTIDGGATNFYTGTILAPYCNITINGGSVPSGFNAQVIGYTIKINGSAVVTFTYDSGVMGLKIDPPKTGIPK